MHFRAIRFLGAGFVAAVATCAIAYAAAPTIESTPVPKPPTPNFSSMRYFLGSWSCSTKSSRRPAPFITTQTNSIDSTGYWMIGKDYSQAMSWFPYTTRGTDMTTYDPSTGRWVDVFTGDLGAYGVSWTTGWKGNTLTSTDALFVPTKDVLSETPTVVTKVSTTRYTTYNTFREGSGRTIVVRATCTKTG